jgi:hypothetical protein
MEPHELAIAAKYIGAGLAAIGTGQPASASARCSASS